MQINDLTGRPIGEFTVKRRVPHPLGRRGTFWECECSCGRVEIVRSTLLVCPSQRLRDRCLKCARRRVSNHFLPGHDTGAVTLVELLDASDPRIMSHKNGHWLCRCRCGAEIVRSQAKLLASASFPARAACPTCRPKRKDRPALDVLPSSGDDISARQWEAVRLFREGLTYRQIASRMGVSWQRVSQLIKTAVRRHSSKGKDMGWQYREEWPADELLSPRELEIVRLRRQGLPPREIAARLGRKVAAVSQALYLIRRRGPNGWRVANHNVSFLVERLPAVTLVRAKAPAGASEEEMTGARVPYNLPEELPVVIAVDGPAWLGPFLAAGTKRTPWVGLLLDDHRAVVVHRNAAQGPLPGTVLSIRSPEDFESPPA